jgi:Cytochrome c7 and related cytochrome c/Cytochrome c3
VRYIYTFLLGSLLAGAQSITEKPPAPQPIPFNHKQHVSLGVKCADCHTIRKPGFVAGYPQEATCMGCHVSIKKDSAAIQKLTEFAKAKQPVPWVKVYRVPDYVWFSHELHHKEAGIECAECHGPVAEREIIVKEKATSMKACMDCHDKRKASNECDVCHDKR